MGIQIDASEAIAVCSRIETGAARVGAQVSAIVRKTALDIEADAKALAPVDTGNLRNSISTTIEGDGRFGTMSAEIGPTTDYAVFQEFGTSVMAPQPFMTPAADRRLPGYTEALARAAEKSIL